MDKRTLSRAASRVALGVTDFLGIKALPGTENYRATPSGRPESEIDSQNDDEPYWMKDDFWNDSVELQSGIPTHITLSHIQKGPPAYSPNRDPPPSYNAHIPPTNPELDDEAPPAYIVLPSRYAPILIY